VVSRHRRLQDFSRPTFASFFEGATLVPLQSTPFSFEIRRQPLGGGADGGADSCLDSIKMRQYGSKPRHFEVAASPNNQNCEQLNWLVEKFYKTGTLPPNCHVHF
jgi:hypothetical protein